MGILDSVGDYLQRWVELEDEGQPNTLEPIICDTSGVV